MIGIGTVLLTGAALPATDTEPVLARELLGGDALPVEAVVAGGPAPGRELRPAPGRAHTPRSGTSGTRCRSHTPVAAAAAAGDPAATGDNLSPCLCPSRGAYPRHPPCRLLVWVLLSPALL